MCRLNEIPRMYVGTQILHLLKQESINLTEKIYRALNNLLDFYSKEIMENFLDKNLHFKIYSELKKKF